jgi:penicillin-binding protein 2
MPSEEWKIKNFKQKWFAGETISVGIGQGAVATTPVQLLRAISAISMDGRMVVPHVANPTDLPQHYLEVNHYNDVKNVSIDTTGWNVITDAMGRVLLPEGTAPSAHIPGIDIAGKTGSAQTVSLETRAKYSKNEAFAQNGWFVGFTPRRNPDIVVAILFEGGEHGRLAARLATQVIKAYVDKQHKRQVEQQNVAQGLSTTAPEVKPATPKTAEVNGVWTDPNDDRMQAGKFQVPVDQAAKPGAKAAPGMTDGERPAGGSPAATKTAPEKPAAAPAATKTGTEKPAGGAPAATKTVPVPTPGGRER